MINKSKTDNKYKKDQFNKGNPTSLKSELNNFKVKINSADTTTFKSLKGNEAKLLLLLAHFFTGKNNGDISLAMSIMKQWFRSNTTLLSAKDGLLRKGFIVINAYGGRSGNGTKLPHLYALTWAPIDPLKGDNNWMRYSHYAAKKSPLSYWKSGANPDVKTKKERDNQFKKDVKKIKKTSISY